ncbi:MAG: N-acetylmuramoyl-L-alanine amidase [Deinococcales bacterium]|nr:N-acetylmuramoyl-L-alanine amidase [Chitinophagaceae bacterium]
MLKRGLYIFICLTYIGSFTNECAAQAKKLRTIVVDAGHGGTDGGATGQYENSLRSMEKNVTLAISKKLVEELKRQLPDVKVIPTRTTDVFDNPRVKANIANDAKGDLFICIHADSGPLKTGRRQIGSKTVTKYKISYTGKGRKKKKKSTPYEVNEPIFEYFKIPLAINGTSVYIFAADKTSDKLKAIMKGQEEIQFETGTADSSYNNFNFSSPEGRQLAQVYAKLYQEKSERMATLVNDEIDATGRRALGVNQRRTGIWVLSATKMPAILIETGYINNPEDERYLNSDKGQQELAEAITKAVIRYKAQLENIKPLAKS